MIWKKECIDLFITCVIILSLLAGRLLFSNDNWQLYGSEAMGHTKSLMSWYQSFAPISAHGLISLWHLRCICFWHNWRY